MKYLLLAIGLITFSPAAFAEDMVDQQSAEEIANLKSAETLEHESAAMAEFFGVSRVAIFDHRGEPCRGNCDPGRRPLPPGRRPLPPDRRPGRGYTCFARDVFGRIWDGRDRFSPRQAQWEALDKCEWYSRRACRPRLPLKIPRLS